MSIHEPPLAPPADPPRRRWPRRHPIWSIVIALASILTISTVAAALTSSSDNRPCLVQNGGFGCTSATAQPSESIPDSGTTESPPAPIPSPSPTEQSGMGMPLGSYLEITQGGTDAAIIKATSANVFTSAADQYGEPPEHGYYVVVHVRAATLPDYADGFDISSGDFYARVAGQHFEEGDGNAYYALTLNQSDMSYVTLAAGEHTSGLLVFDVPRPHGQIVYAPNFDGQPVGSWKF